MYGFPAKYQLFNPLPSLIPSPDHSGKASSEQAPPETLTQTDPVTPMQKFVPMDPHSGVSKTHWAVIYVPRRSRNRFSASCVQLFTDQEQALQACDPDKKQFAAKVIGPSKSSEGQSLYYLVHWLGISPET